MVAQCFLLIASDNLTHNLRDYQIVRQSGGPTPAYVRGFADRMRSGDREALLDYRQQAPDAVRAHPSDEHLLPLYVALGAAGEGADVTRIHLGIDGYILAMDAYTFLLQQRTPQ